MKAQAKQITIIILVLIVLIGALYMLQPAEEAPVIPRVEQENLYLYTENCLQKTLEDGLVLLGLQGGYIWENNDVGSYKSQGIPVHYSYLEQLNLLPSTTQMLSDELAPYIEVSIGTCLKGFSGFDVINYDKPVVKVLSAENSVLAEMKMPIILKTGKVDTFSAAVPARLSLVRDLMNKLIEKAVSDPNYIATGLLEAYTKVGIDSKAFVIDDTTMVYSISDSHSAIKGRPFFFQSALKFSANKAPELQELPPQVIAVGEVMDIFAKAKDPENDALTYSVNDDRFWWDNNGHIMFEPKQPGVYGVLVTVWDGAGNTDSTQLYVEVIQ